MKQRDERKLILFIEHIHESSIDADRMCRKNGQFLTLNFRKIGFENTGNRMETHHPFYGHWKINFVKS